MLKLNNYFNLAVSYYKNNNIDEAKKWFQEIISFAPKMYVAEISKNYLDSTEKGIISFDNFPKVVPDESFRIIEKVPFKKMRLLKKAAWVLIAVSIVLSMVLTIYLQNDNTKNHTEYIEQLNDAIALSYDDFELLGYCNVESDDEIVDVIGLVYSENKIDVVAFVTYSDGTDSLKRRIANAKYDKYYSFESTCKTHQLYVELIDSEDYNDSLAKIECEINGEKKVFVVEQIARLK